MQLILSLLLSIFTKENKYKKEKANALKNNLNNFG